MSNPDRPAVMGGTAIPPDRTQYFIARRSISPTRQNSTIDRPDDSTIAA
jgi:hypothetical protein